MIVELLPRFHESGVSLLALLFVPSGVILTGEPMEIVCRRRGGLYCRWEAAAAFAARCCSSVRPTASLQNSSGPMQSDSLT